MKAMTPEQRRLRDEFFASDQWRGMRYTIIKRDGARCAACGRTPTVDGIRIHVDHIQPISLCWERRLDPSNLQVLCEDCNLGKSNEDNTDWRAPANTFTITRPMLLTASCSGSGLVFTAAQLKVFDMKYPLRGHWARNLIGRRTTKEQWDRFVAAKLIRSGKSMRRSATRADKGRTEELDRAAGVSSDPGYVILTVGEILKHQPKTGFTKVHKEALGITKKKKWITKSRGQAVTVEQWNNFVRLCSEQNFTT